MSRSVNPPDRHQPRSTIDGKYELVTELGAGAAGTVFEAEHRVVGKRCAVKILHAELGRDPALVARFVAEARAGARIAHANVVDIYDLGVAPDGTTYMVMELLQGETLADVIGSRGPVASAYACELVLQVLAGLAAAHKKGIVHRDLKPANIIVTHPRPDRPHVKVLDFGIAKGVLDAGYTSEDGVILGTPLYMAPEQALARQVDGRADVYAAGVILYEMLSGAPPHDGSTPMEVLGKVVQGLHLPLHEVCPDLPRELADAVERALRVDPADRFESAEEFSEALLPFVSVERASSLAPAPGSLSQPPIPLVPRVGAIAIHRPAPSMNPNQLLRLSIPVYARPTDSLLCDPHFPAPDGVPRVSGIPDFSPEGLRLSAGTAAELAANTVVPFGRMRRGQLKTALFATAAGIGLGSVLAWLASSI